MPKDPTKEPMFEEVVSALDTGEPGRRFTADWRALITKLVARADDDDKASGSLTLTLKVHVTRKGEIEIAPSVAVKVPPEKVKKLAGWLTADGAVTATDPRQARLNLKDAPANGNVIGLNDHKKAGA